MKAAQGDPGDVSVELRGLCKRFGSRVVLDDVSLGVRRGEFFALVGPSGSGKSTLLKVVSGIEAPTSGHVWQGGQDVTSLPPYRRGVHTVFQNYALFPHLDVAGNVGFPLRMAGVPRGRRAARVAQVLEWVRLGAFTARRVGGLSGGERQRVALARALVDEPESVLLDEPLSALDPHLRGQTLELLQEIQARLGVTYLYVTHDREEALRAAHRIGVLNQGRLEQVGTPEELYHRPRSAFVASFLGPINWLLGECATSQGRPGVRLRTGQEVPLDGQAPPQTRCVRLGIRPEHVRLGADGLLAARVTHRQFAGATVALRLEVEGGTSVAVEVRDGAHAPAVGECVRIGWAPGVAHLFGEAP